MVWTCSKKANKCVGEKSWSPIKRGRGRPRGTLGEFIKCDLLVNNILKEVGTNRAQ